ncbi:unnamed protein product [Phaeothamnion confervicola]
MVRGDKCMSWVEVELCQWLAAGAFCALPTFCFYLQRSLQASFYLRSSGHLPVFLVLRSPLFPARECKGLVAFALILVEVQLVSLTSSLSMGVIGNIKDIVQIAIAVLVYHDQVSALNILGLVLAISGGWLYKRQRGAPAAEAGANGGGKAGSNGGGGGRNGGGPALLPYAVVSQEEADDELKVFRMQGTDWDLDADLSDGWNDLG